MNLDEALRSLFLRQLRADKLAAESTGNGQTATRIGELATALSVERDKTAKEYRVTLAGTSLAWNFPETEFSFYTRGDRVPANAPASISLEDPQYERNLANARRWLQTFRESFDA
jgi:hypothetical protein